jgi:hypothetical protein
MEEVIMRGITTLILAGPLLLGSVACRDRMPNPDRMAEARDASEVTVTGCLTAAPNRDAFVVTASRDALTTSTLSASAGEIATYAYELVGGADLSSNVGREVEVKGELLNDGARDVDMDAKEKSEMPPARVGRDTVSPAVETNAEVELKVRRLQVASLTPTGAPCH